MTERSTTVAPPSSHSSAKNSPSVSSSASGVRPSDPGSLISSKDSVVSSRSVGTAGSAAANAERSSALALACSSPSGHAASGWMTASTSSACAAWLALAATRAVALVASASSGPRARMLALRPCAEAFASSVASTGNGASLAAVEYEPDEEEILADLLPRNIAVQIYRAMLENQAGFYGSQMTAMDNATRNAGDMINRLTIQYNRSRQAAITTELIEIIAGAEAL